MKIYRIGTVHCAIKYFDNTKDWIEVEKIIDKSSVILDSQLDYSDPEGGRIVIARRKIKNGNKDK